MTWGIPAALVVLFLVLIVRQADGRNPVSWAQDRLSVDGFGSRDTAARGLVVVMTPIQANEFAITGEAPVALETPEASALAAAQKRMNLPLPADAAAPEPAAVNAEDSAILEPTAAPRGLPAAAITPAEQAMPPIQATEFAITGEVAADSPAEPAMTLTPTAAPVPGDAIVAAAANTRDATDPLELPTATPTNTETATPELSSTPTRTATPVPTDTATPVPMPTYEIRRGDTLVVVARRNGVSVEDLMRVNGISPAEAFTLQPGQELLIPVEGSAGAEEPTSTPTVTSTATAVLPPTKTPVPTATTPALRLDAPILRSPEPGTPVSCSEPTSLVWLPVPFMRTDDKFVLHLGFANGRMEDGRDIVIWVLEQPRPANVTSWDTDGNLCSLAPQEYGRKWYWFVEVAEEVDGALKPVSPPSKTWDFSWN